MSSFSVVLKGGPPWGFRIQGGREFEEPLKIAKINPNSKAYAEGIKVGDFIDGINRQRTHGLNHGDAQQLIKNATDELLLELRRGEITSNGPVNGEIHQQPREIHVTRSGDPDTADISHPQTNILNTDQWSDKYVDTVKINTDSYVLEKKTNSDTTVDSREINIDHTDINTDGTDKNLDNTDTRFDNTDINPDSTERKLDKSDVETIKINLENTDRKTDNTDFDLETTDINLENTDRKTENRDIDLETTDINPENTDRKIDNIASRFDNTDINSEKRDTNLDSRDNDHAIIDIIENYSSSSGLDRESEKLENMERGEKLRNNNMDYHISGSEEMKFHDERYNSNFEEKNLNLDLAVDGQDGRYEINKDDHERMTNNIPKTQNQKSNSDFCIDENRNLEYGNIFDSHNGDKNRESNFEDSKLNLKVESNHDTDFGSKRHIDVGSNYDINVGSKHDIDAGSNYDINGESRHDIHFESEHDSYSRSKQDIYNEPNTDIYNRVNNDTYTGSNKDVNTESKQSIDNSLTDLCGVADKDRTFSSSTSVGFAGRHDQDRFMENTSFSVDLKPSQRIDMETETVNGVGVKGSTVAMDPRRDHRHAPSTTSQPWSSYGETIGSSKSFKPVSFSSNRIPSTPNSYTGSPGVVSLTSSKDMHLTESPENSRIASYGRGSPQSSVKREMFGGSVQSGREGHLVQDQPPLPQPPERNSSFRPAFSQPPSHIKPPTYEQSVNRAPNVSEIPSFMTHPEVGRFQQLDQRDVKEFKPKQPEWSPNEPRSQQFEQQVSHSDQQKSHFDQQSHHYLEQQNADHLDRSRHPRRPFQKNEDFSRHHGVGQFDRFDHQSMPHYQASRNAEGFDRNVPQQTLPQHTEFGRTGQARDRPDDQQFPGISGSRSSSAVTSPMFGKPQGKEPSWMVSEDDSVFLEPDLGKKQDSRLATSPFGKEPVGDAGRNNEGVGYGRHFEQDFRQRQQDKDMGLHQQRQDRPIGYHQQREDRDFGHFQQRSDRETGHFQQMQDRDAGQFQQRKDRDMGQVQNHQPPWSKDEHRHEFGTSYSQPTSATGPGKGGDQPLSQASTSPYPMPSRSLSVDSSPRMIPIEIRRTKPVPFKPEKTTSESDAFDFRPQTESSFSPWKPSASKPDDGSQGSQFAAGSYSTLPAKRSARLDNVTDARDSEGHFDFNIYSTLPTIKPLRSKKSVEFADMPTRYPHGDLSSTPDLSRQGSYGTPGDLPYTSTKPKSALYKPGDISIPDRSADSSRKDSDFSLSEFSIEQKIPSRKEGDLSLTDFSGIQSKSPSGRSDFPLSDTYPSKTKKDYSEPLWASTDVVSSSPKSSRDDRSTSSSNVTSSDSRDTIVSRDSSSRVRDVCKDDEMMMTTTMMKQEKLIPVTVIHEEAGKSSVEKVKLGQAKDENTEHQTFNSLPPYKTSFSEKPSEAPLNGPRDQHQVTPKPALWTPGVQPSKFTKASLERQSSGEKAEQSLKDIPSVWTPGGSPGGVRKTYKPVKLDTSHKHVKPVKDIKTSETFVWSPKHSKVDDSKSVSTTSFTYPSSSTSLLTTTTTAATTASTTQSRDFTPASRRGEPTRVGNVNGTAHMNGSIDSSNVFNESKDDLHLPPTQSPYITLLQKTRENENLDDIRLDAPIMVKDEGQIPKGAVYIGKKETVEGDKKYTDSYYVQPTQEETSTTTVIEAKPKIYEGIGPVDNDGLPLGFRKNVDEKKQHEWYKQMFKTLHKTDKKEDILGINQLIDSIFEDADENTYQPTYVFPDDISDTRSEEDRNYGKTSNLQDDSGYRSEPEGKFKNLYKGRNRSISEVEKKEPRRHYWSPANARATIDIYKNQPRSIMDYEPGFSSIALREAKTGIVHNPPIEKPGEFSSYSIGRRRQTSVPDISNAEDDWDSQDMYKRVQQGGDIPYKGLQKPAPEKPKKNPDMTSSTTATTASSQFTTTTAATPPPPNEASKVTKPSTLSQNSTVKVPSPPIRSNKSPALPKTRLRLPQSCLPAAQQLKVKSPPSLLITNENGVFRHPTTDVWRKQPITEKERRRREEEELYRKKRLEQLYEEEKQRKIQQEEADQRARKHSDFFTPSQKSPIPLDRFDNVQPAPGGGLTVPPERRRGFQIQGKARALYNFKAQNPRELSLKRGDIVYLLRQIDKNWFEGERYGVVGHFPVNYVEVLTSIEAAKMAAMQSEGQAKVKYNFTAQSNVELSLRKGEFVVLLRAVDDNWFEGRIGNQQGIFPMSYVEVIREPSTPLVTPAPSVITTPMTGTPEMLSPASMEAPTPPPQPSPSAFAQRSPTGTSFGYRQASPGSGRSHTSQLSPLSDLTSQRPHQSPTFGRKPMSPRGVETGLTPPSNPIHIIPTDNRTKVADDDLALTRYRAVYAYKPQNEDELELQEGDEVFVMEKCDDGWFVGTSARTGQFGTFPGNYVQQF